MDRVLRICWLPPGSHEPGRGNSPADEHRLEDVGEDHVMQRFQRVLISLVGDQAEPAALARGASLARHTGATLKLIDVLGEFSWYARLAIPNLEELKQIAEAQRTERLEALAAPLRQEGITVSVELLHGRAGLETVREVIRGGHDLLLKDAETTDGGRFASSDMYLLRTCPCPAWLVRPIHRDKLFARILAAVDPLPEELEPIGAEARKALNARILELSISLAEWDGGEVHVIHVWEAPVEGLLRWRGEASREQVDHYTQAVRNAAREALDRFLAPFIDRIGRGQVHLVRGTAGEAIPQFAETRDVDLIVMGTVARTGIAGFVIGNTAETILQRVRCSVLAVKPPGFVSPVVP
jgi:universal stress protein E